MKKISYEFVGNESDKRKFVDPEPEIGQLYSSKQYWSFHEKNFDNIGDPFYDMFKEVSMEIPEPERNANDILTPMMRLEIVKAFPEKFEKWGLEGIQNYIAFGFK